MTDPTPTRAAPPRMALLLAAVLAATFLPGARAEACRLALAMGFDVSRSVDAAAHEIQIRGILGALFDPGIRDALLDPAGPVALAAYEWSGRREQRMIVGWTLVETPDDIDRVARAIAAHGRSFAGLTAVGSALAYGHRLLARAPACDAQILDIAGDGQTNDGPDPARVYARRDFGAITVNGLAIGGHESGILAYYEREVIRGPGAFAEYAPTHRDFAEAFRRKLLRELAPPLIGHLAPPPRAPGAGRKGGWVGAPLPGRAGAAPYPQAASSPASARRISATVSSTP